MKKSEEKALADMVSKAADMVKENPISTGDDPRIEFVATAMAKVVGAGVRKNLEAYFKKMNLAKKTKYAREVKKERLKYLQHLKDIEQERKMQNIK